MRRHIRHVGGDAGNQATASHRNDDGIERLALGRKLCHNLRCDPALSGDGIAGVEGLNEGGVALGGVGMRGRGCFIEVGADHHQLHLVAAVD